MDEEEKGGEEKERRKRSGNVESNELSLIKLN